MLHAEVDRLDPAVDICGPHVSDAQLPPRWQGAALLQPGRALPVDLSMLHLATPAILAKEDPDDLIARLVEWCRQIQPLHGTAGLSPIYDIGMQQNHPEETWPLLSRFSGLDDMNPFVLAARRQPHPRIIWPNGSLRPPKVAPRPWTRRRASIPMGAGW